MLMGVGIVLGVDISGMRPFFEVVDMIVVCRLMGGVIWGIFRLRRRVRILVGCLFSAYLILHPKSVFYGDFIAISSRSFINIIDYIILRLSLTYESLV